VLLGYGLLSLVTASIAAMFVGSQERKVERDILHDMHTQMRSLRHEIDGLRNEVRQLRQGNAPADAAAPSDTHHKD
jgi:voltage-gated potassium channel